MPKKLKKSKLNKEADIHEAFIDVKEKISLLTISL